MTTVVIRKKLTDYLQVAENKKLKAELDKRYNAYKKGNKTVSGYEAKKQISKILAA